MRQSLKNFHTVLIRLPRAAFLWTSSLSAVLPSSSCWRGFSSCSSRVVFSSDSFTSWAEEMGGVSFLRAHTSTIENFRIGNDTQRSVFRIHKIFKRIRTSDRYPDFTDPDPKHLSAIANERNF
jgi:hypothetical protein